MRLIDGTDEYNYALHSDVRHSCYRGTATCSLPIYVLKYICPEKNGSGFLPSYVLGDGKQCFRCVKIDRI